MALITKGILDDGNGIVTLKVRNDGVLTATIDPESKDVETAPPSVTSDELTKVSANDTTAGYLEDKVVVTSDLTKATLNDGADEDVQLGLADAGAGAGATGGSGDFIESITLDAKGRVTAVTATAPAGGTDELTKVSANDTTAGYLEDKIVVTANLTKATLNDGADEDVQLDLADAGAGAGATGGSGDFIESITLDAKGRVTAVTAAAPPGGSGGDLTVTETNVVSDTDEIGFTSLTGNTAKGYVFSTRIKNNNVGASVYTLEINGATTGVSWQRLYASITVVAADQVGEYSIASGGQIEISVTIPRPASATGFVRSGYIDIVTTVSGSATSRSASSFSWNSTDEITSLAIASDTVDGIGTGSTAKLETHS